MPFSTHVSLVWCALSPGEVESFYDAASVQGEDPPYNTIHMQVRHECIVNRQLASIMNVKFREFWRVGAA